MWDRREEREREREWEGESANLPTLHSFVALFFRYNRPADCAPARTGEKSIYTSRQRAAFIPLYIAY